MGEIVWKDRKRHFGLPLSFTKYSIEDDRLFVETGFFTTHIDEVLLYRIQDMSLKITLGQKLFGVGTISIVSTDKSLSNFDLVNIKDPKKVKEILHDHVEAMKDRKRMRVSEIIDDHDHFDDDQGDLDSYSNS